MAGYTAYLASLIVFTFGALTFTVLAVTYWREWRPRGERVFPLFTLLCAVAFASNLLARVIPNASLATALMLLRELATGLLPAVLVHLSSARGAGRALRWFYAVCAALAVAHGLSATELVNVPAADWFDAAPGALLAGASAWALVLTFRGGGSARQRLWNRAVLALLALSSAAALAISHPLLPLIPDYLLLAFFCVTLYYQERLVFFDLLIKRGAYFVLSVVLLAWFVTWFPLSPEPWMAALALAPLWLLGPWLERRLGQAIDRLWLGRRYSPAEAERRFVNTVQAAANEADLCVRAGQVLAEIFRTRAEVHFAAAPTPPSAGAMVEGGVVLHPRPDSIPFMSDDRRLLQSLARTLAVVLENVRFRDQRLQQEEREQQLRLLASRSELKALRAQINPHFLFNALNAIAGLIQEQPELADETVEQLAQVFRYTLRKSDSEWVRLEEEVEFITSYLRVEQARFGRRLKVEIEVDPAVAAVMVPAMTVQPVVENAVKHGASAVTGLAVVGLRVTSRDRQLAIEVTDNGPGFPPGFSLGAAPNPRQSGSGLGMRNIVERLKGYYGDAARLQWARRDGITHVSMTIPMADSREPATRNTRVASVDR